MSDTTLADPWQSRRLATLAQAKRHTAFIRKARVFLIGLAILIVLSLMVVATIRTLTQKAGVRADYGADASIRMVNARFTGRTKDGKMFVVSSSEAVRPESREDTINLDNPIIEEGTGAVAAAKKGVYDTSKEHVDLSGGVIVEDGRGFQIRTESAKVSVDARSVEGPRPVSGSGPLGDIRADRFEFENGGDIIRLHGNVRTVIATNEERNRRNAEFAASKAANNKTPQAISRSLANAPKPLPAPLVPNIPGELDSVSASTYPPPQKP